MTLNILILLGILLVFQLIIGHLLHDVGFSYTKSIILMCLPLGIGLFYLQLFYYERRFPKWDVPLNVKLRLKYMYILTFFEFVALYICIFRM
ncbi:hypothetical protein [Staphylococcus caeli]|uniref:Membrane spanning protein n=1 Tax=Staphylococcus caeli TaxID=2201815 RepID=A0A1D4GR00_9STAP|nr:hypothetical protein [Staphylococcus caeli]SCS27399.1 Putative membrane spanning protein [Staphylococcus caeli]SCS39232.1 Putative membrane spanning protein [Staphylococcus caeli]